MAPRTGLIVGGSILLGSVWLINILAGAATEATCGDAVLSTMPCPPALWPVYIPVVGPFIQMGFLNNDVNRTAYLAGLAFDGIVQLGGLTMIILGATLRHRVPIMAQRWQVSPTILSGGTGLAYSLRF
jgi:hypothetical protein